MLRGEKFSLLVQAQGAAPSGLRFLSTPNALLKTDLAALRTGILLAIYLTVQRFTKQIEKPEDVVAHCFPGPARLLTGF